MSSPESQSPFPSSLSRVNDVQELTGESCALLPDLFTMNDIIALSHMKLSTLSSSSSRKDEALLHKSILIVNALEAYQASQSMLLFPAPSSSSFEVKWSDSPASTPFSDDASFFPPTPVLTPLKLSDYPIDLDNIFLEPPVEPEISHVEVVEVGDSDDDLSDDDDYETMASSIHSIASFTMEDSFSPPSSPSVPQFYDFSYPSSPSSSAHPTYDDFSDDEDDAELVTPPQPILLDDFAKSAGESDFDQYDDDELAAVEGLQLFGAPRA